MTDFPPGYVLREATEADAEAAVDVLIAAGDADRSPRAIAPADIRNGLRHYIARVVDSPSGDLAAYLDVFIDRDRAYVDAVVHPRARGKGVGAALLATAEEIASERIDGRYDAVLRCGIAGASESARELHESRGYSYVRSFFRMEAELDSPPETPEWRDGLTVRPFQAGDERVMYDLLTEAFRDHWEGERGEPYEQFEEHDLDPLTFRPQASFVVFDGDEPAAGVISAHRFGMGWIGSLGVRRRWRQQGVGLALLRQALGALYEAGERRVGLGVDAENITGATRLYERAGMHVAARFDTFEKKLAAE